jgi:hypothetical protein
MSSAIRIDARFNGPTHSANGGIACGAIAAVVGGRSVAVRLHAPPPLDTDLAISVDAEGGVEVHHGTQLVATARPAPPLDDVVPPVRPTVEEARDAMTRHVPFPPGDLRATCFVCSGRRPDGLRLTFGPLAADPDVTAAVLRTDASLPTVNGRVAPAMLWGALDCPGFVPSVHAAGHALLGSLEAELLEDAVPGETLICVGWLERHDGRKHHTATALLREDGTLVGRARHVWITLRES